MSSRSWGYSLELSREIRAVINDKDLGITEEEDMVEKMGDDR